MNGWLSAVPRQGVVTIQIVRLARQDLYDLVWSEPMRTVAARFNLSDVGLKKICTKHRIPVPARGYWRRVETGQNPPAIALPKYAGASEIVIRVKPEAERTSRDFEAQNATESGVDPIAVAAKLERPHATTRAMQAALRARSPDNYGAIHSKVADAFLARLHPSSMERVLRIADALAKACDKLGYELRPGKEGAHYGGQLRIVVEGQEIELSFEERMRQEPYQLTANDIARQKRGGYVYTPKYQYVPTGLLTVTIGRAYSLNRRWTDSRKQRIEECLDQVFLGLRKLAARKIAERDEQLRKAAILQQERQRRADIKARIEAERQAIAQLENDARDWRRAEEIRAFVDARRKAQSSDESWLAWALQQADRIDPLRESPSSILDTNESEYREVSIWEFDKYADEPEPELPQD